MLPHQPSAHALRGDEALDGGHGCRQRLHRPRVATAERLEAPTNGVGDEILVIAEAAVDRNGKVTLVVPRAAANQVISTRLRVTSAE